MKIARSTKRRVFLEIKDFNFRNKTVFHKWCSFSNMRMTIEGRYNYDLADIKYEINRCEEAINSGELICNAKNRRYIGNLYKELDRLTKAA